MALHELKRGTRRYQVNDTAVDPYASPRFSISGGTLSYNGTRSVVTVTSSATLTSAYGPANVEFLLVGGGGGGGWAGAGAGGVIYNASYEFQTSSYSITIGQGGSGSNNNNVDGIVGEDSVFAEYRASGGGYGSSNDGVGGGGVGGSGGGGNSIHAGAGSAISASAQGNDGGFATNYGPPYSSCGGGGAGQVGGVNINASVSGNGGSGSLYSINGTPTYYAGGGAGGPFSSGTAGKTPPGHGTNLGGGGNGNSAPAISNNGDAGILIISYDT
jgi:hypothetical protein